MAAQDSVLVQIARPYAQALYDIAHGDGSVEQVEQGLVELAALSQESADFVRFLRSPVIAAPVKASAIEAILAKANAHPTVASFVRVVAANGRLFALDQIVAAFRQLAAEGRGEIAAEVTSAVALSSEQRAALAETLKARVGKTVTLSEHVDASLIGGLQVKVGSQMIDSSLKTKLSAMKVAMKEVG